MARIVLSPAGTVRSTYRTFELFQHGIVPWIIQDKYKIIPYLDSTVQYNDIMFYSDLPQVYSTIPKLRDESENRLAFMRRTMVKYRKTHFQPNGLMDQIQRFLLTGDEDSDLRPIRVRRVPTLKPAGDF